MRERHIPTRRQAKRLYVAGVKPWSGCAAYFEFEDSTDLDATDWKARGGLWAGCHLRVVPLKGQRDWDYCRRVEAEIARLLTAGEVSP
ncbi:hypothetical protein [Bradyrhizobium sp. STM 3809]|uniref:hypothetical protein n=1 Tax=Bradyrhizobium sp. STM 3809 TaxID=551936 RepID=UPI00111190AF|nr:hypothetical protein [Bradyrhizobium sp. STM 3809]